MSHKTPHFGFEAIGSGESFSLDDYQFTLKDKDDLDTLLYALFTRRPGDASVTSDAPVNPPSLSLSYTGGSIGPGEVVRYKYALVDVNGIESTASPEATVTTPSAIQPPPSPRASLQSTTGGTLLPGTYFYGLSAYVDTSSNETTVTNTASMTVASGTTNKVLIQFPTLPSGSTGINIYRRAPGETTLSFLTSMDTGGATPITSYIDDGTVAENCNHQPSLKNVTNSKNSITVSVAGATPVVPDGYTWKIYRTYTASNYSNSLLESVVTETSEGSGIITPTFLDTGTSTSAGSPRTTVLDIPAYDKIDIGTEAIGSLSLGDQVFSTSITLRLDGAATTGEVDGWWVCPYDKAQIVSYFLSADTPPSGTLLVDIETYDGGTPTWHTIFDDPASRPFLTAGQYVTDTLSLTSSADDRLLQGVAETTTASRLRMNIISGATDATFVTLTVNLIVQTGADFDPFEFDT